MTSTANSIDIARVELLLNELRLPGVKAIWSKLAAQSDKECWPALLRHASGWTSSARPWRCARPQTPRTLASRIRRPRLPLDIVEGMAEPSRFPWSNVLCPPRR